MLPSYMHPGKPVGLGEAISCSNNRGILPWQNHGKTQVHPSKRQRTWARGKALTGRDRGPQSLDCIKAPPQNHSPLNRGPLLPFNPAVNK